MLPYPLIPGGLDTDFFEIPGGPELLEDVVDAY